MSDEQPTDNEQSPQVSGHMDVDTLYGDGEPRFDWKFAENPEAEPISPLPPVRYVEKMLTEAQKDLPNLERFIVYAAPKRLDGGVLARLYFKDTSGWVELHICDTCEDLQMTVERAKELVEFHYAELKKQVQGE